METFRSIERPRDEFMFAPEADDTAVLKEVTPSPEAYRGCLVEAMHAANSGDGVAREEVMSTVVASRGSDLAMSCGRCGLIMVRDGGVVYGASRCPKVRSEQTYLGELA